MPLPHCHGGSSIASFLKIGWTRKLVDLQISFCHAAQPRSGWASNRSTARSIGLSKPPTASPAKQWHAICFWKMPRKGSMPFFRSGQPIGAGNDYQVSRHALSDFMDRGVPSSSSNNRVHRLKVTFRLCAQSRSCDRHYFRRSECAYCWLKMIESLPSTFAKDWKKKDTSWTRALMAQQA